MKSGSKQDKDSNEKQNGRREAIRKGGFYLLSASTLMILLESQAKAQTSPASPPVGDFD